MRRPRSRKNRQQCKGSDVIIENIRLLGDRLMRKENQWGNNRQRWLKGVSIKKIGAPGHLKRIRGKKESVRGRRTNAEGDAGATGNERAAEETLRKKILNRRERS